MTPLWARWRLQSPAARLFTQPTYRISRYVWWKDGCFIGGSWRTCNIYHCPKFPALVDILGQNKHGRHFADGIFTCVLICVFVRTECLFVCKFYWSWLISSQLRINQYWFCYWFGAVSLPLSEPLMAKFINAYMRDQAQYIKICAPYTKKCWYSAHAVDIQLFNHTQHGLFL